MTKKKEKNLSVTQHATLVAEMFEQDLKKCSALPAVGLPKHINHVTLCDLYLNRKWDIYLLEKLFCPNKPKNADR
jgi:hypothetical protein